LAVLFPIEIRNISPIISLNGGIRCVVDDWILMFWNAIKRFAPYSLLSNMGQVLAVTGKAGTLL